MLLSLILRIFGLGLNGLILVYLAYRLPPDVFAYFATWLACVTIVSNIGSLGLQHRLLDHSMCGAECGAAFSWHAFGALVAVALACIGAAVWSLTSEVLDYNVLCTLLAILLQGLISTRCSELMRTANMVSALIPEHFYRPLFLAICYVTVVESEGIFSPPQILTIYVMCSFSALICGAKPLYAMSLGVYRNKFRLPELEGIVSFSRSSLSQAIQINSEQFLILFVGLTQTAVITTSFRLISLAAQVLQVIGHGMQLYFLRELSTSLKEKNSSREFNLVYRKVRKFMIAGFIVSLFIALLGYYTFIHFLFEWAPPVLPVPEGMVLIFSIGLLVSSGPMAIALERGGGSSSISLVYGLALILFAGFLVTFQMTVGWLMLIYAGYFALVTLSLRESLNRRILIE